MLAELLDNAAVVDVKEVLAVAVGSGPFVEFRVVGKHVIAQDIHCGVPSRHSGINIAACFRSA